MVKYLGDKKDEWMDALTVLYEAKKVCGVNLILLEMFNKVATEKGWKTVDALIDAKEACGSDLILFSGFYILALDQGFEAVDVLVEAKEVFKSEKNLMNCLYRLEKRMANY